MKDAQALRVLLTGFEPFDGESINPSWEAARALHGWCFTSEEGARRVTVQARQLPCVFGAALQALDAHLADVQPQVVLALGQAGGRPAFTPERVAINVDDGRICDNAGYQPVDQAVVADGPAAYFSNLPIKRIVQAVRGAGLPAEVSNSAGTFVCNHVFYGLMHRLAQQQKAVASGGLALWRAGFIHIPYLPEQASRLPGPPSAMPLADVVRALRLAVQASVSAGPDLRQSGGALH